MKAFLVSMSALAFALPANAIGEWTTYYSTGQLDLQVIHMGWSKSIAYIETRLFRIGHKPVLTGDWAVNCTRHFILSSNGREQRQVNGIWRWSDTGYPSDRHTQKLYEFACQ